MTRSEAESTGLPDPDRAVPARRRRTVGVVAVAVAALASRAVLSQPGRPDDGRALARAAAAQVGVTLVYDPSYRRLDYPGGDVPLERGVCADVVVRAFRKVGVDLQVALHEDMQRHFDEYPRRWGLDRPDANIDHRRVPNLMTFFERRGKRLPAGAPYEPGDVVAWRLPNGLYHIGIAGAQRAPQGHPLMVHNIGQGARVEDVLYAFEQLGHYRW
jgi:uncharacterized protein YijF (DUF1287 family)